jgi:C4-dicarboxylate transporter
MRMLKNVVELERPQMTSQLGALTLCILDKQGYTHALTHTHTDKLVIFVAFPRQQLLRVYASMLLYTYIAYLVQNFIHKEYSKL